MSCPYLTYESEHLMTGAVLSFGTTGNQMVTINLNKSIAKKISVWNKERVVLVCYFCYTHRQVHTPRRQDHFLNKSIKKVSVKC